VIGIYPVPMQDLRVVQATLVTKFHGSGPSRGWLLIAAGCWTVHRFPFQTSAIHWSLGRRFGHPESDTPHRIRNG
jgi:hypothetical protein